MPVFEIDPDNPPLSEVRIPINIDIGQLEQGLNADLGDLLFEDENTDGEGLHLKATLREDIRLALESDAIEYVVPIDIWMSKPFRLATVEGTAALEVRLRTNYSIRADWSFSTITQVMEHQWLEKPKVKVGFIQLPVEFIADKALEKSKALLGQTIDDQIRDLLDLRGMIDQTWDQLYQPLALSEEYKTWMILQPVNMGMTPMTQNGEFWSSTISVTARPEVYIGQEPDHVLAPSLPPFQWQEAGNDGFSIFIRTEIPYDQAEALARESLLGQTFSQGSREVEVTEIDIYGKGNKIAVETSLTGSFTGSVELLMKPFYDPKAERFDVELEKVQVRTGNFLYKSIAWLFKGKIKTELESQMRSFLNDNLDILHQTVEGQLSATNLTDGIQLNGELSELAIRSALVKIDYLELWIELDGRIGLDVEGI